MYRFAKTMQGLKLRKNPYSSESDLYEKKIVTFVYLDM
jgi:hypothetical protein